MANRTPYNLRCCLETNCHWRLGNKCTESYCRRKGNEKRAVYFTKHGELAKGDVPE